MEKINLDQEIEDKIKKIIDCISDEKWQDKINLLYATVDYIFMHSEKYIINEDSIINIH